MPARSAHMQRHTYCGLSILSVGVLGAWISCANMAEPIEMTFGG